MTESGTSMLAAMAAGTLASKTEKAGKTLTPVAGERPQKIAAPFPNDMPTEVMAEAAKEITRVIGILGDALAALHEAGVPQTAPVPQAVEQDQKAIEKAADEAAKARSTSVIQRAAYANDVDPEFAAAQAAREGQPVDIEAFKARLAEQQAEAQAAVYTQPSPVLEAAQAAADAGGGPREVLGAAMAAEGWVCPTHGEAVVRLAKRSQREYRACPLYPDGGCDEFERL